MQIIDARGLACPAPVIETKKVVEKGAEHLQVIVDNDAARQNVSRFLESRGYEAASREEQGIFEISGSRVGEPSREDAPIVCDVEAPAPKEKKILVMITADRMGRGDDTLGAGLMGSFIKTLKEMGPELWRIVFVNSGVKLAIEGAAALPDLEELVQNRVSILVCGTCLNHFNLLEKKAVGETTNMLDIVTSLQLADRVINI